MKKRRSQKESTKKKDLSQEHLMNLKKSKENKLNPRSRMVCFNGMLFNTIKDFSTAYGYDSSTVNAWLNKRYQPANKAFITVRYATELDIKNKNNVRYDKSMGRLKEPVFDWTAYFDAECKEEQEALDRYYGLVDESSSSSASTETVVYLGSKEDNEKDIDAILFDYIDEDDDYMYDDFEIMWYKNIKNELIEKKEYSIKCGII